MASTLRSGHQFELTVLGCSGGPLDRGSCAYLLKPFGVSYSDIVKSKIDNKFICIDGGSGLSGLIELICKLRRGIIMKENALLELYKDSLPVSEYTFCETTMPFDFSIDNLSSPYQLGTKIMERLENYLITHAHADHVLGMVLNSPSFLEKTITGTLSTIEILTKNIFNNRIWPALSTLKFKVLKDEIDWFKLTEDFEIKYFTNSHGSFLEENQKLQYESNAYLINHSTSGRKLLVFGDVELDSVSLCRKNRVIWEKVAPFIFHNHLLAIVIECSHFNLPSNVPLYGHMSPDYLVLELKNLKDILQKAFGNEATLNGLHIIITHVKESVSGFDPRRRVLKELQDLNKKHGLGLEFTIALPGLTYCL